MIYTNECASGSLVVIPQYIKPLVRSPIPMDMVNLFRMVKYGILL